MSCTVRYGMCVRMVPLAAQRCCPLGARFKRGFKPVIGIAGAVSYVGRILKGTVVSSIVRVDLPLNLLFGQPGDGRLVL